MKSIASCSFRTRPCWSWAKSTTARTSRSSSPKKSCRSKTLPVVTPNRSTFAFTPPASPQERLLFRQQGVAVPECGAPGHQLAEFFVVLAGEEERGPFAHAADVLPGRFERGTGGFFALAAAQF